MEPAHTKTCNFYTYLEPFKALLVTKLTNEFLEEPVTASLEYFGEDQRSQAAEQLNEAKQDQDHCLGACQVHHLSSLCCKLLKRDKHFKSFCLKVKQDSVEKYSYFLFILNILVFSKCSKGFVVVVGIENRRKYIGGIKTC